MNPINVVLASGKEVLPLNEAFMDAGIVILIVFAVLFIIFCLFHFLYLNFFTLISSFILFIYKRCKYSNFII